MDPATASEASLLVGSAWPWGGSEQEEVWEAGKDTEEDSEEEMWD